MGLIVYTLLISLAVPVDRAINYFRIIAAFFSFLTISTLIGITYFLITQGFHPLEKMWDPKKWTWVVAEPVHTYFSVLTLAGYIMLSLYFVPMILRPVDFARNVPKYVIGLVSYILLLPTFINVMQIYSMSNLHDISWGNRPSVSAGTNALSAN